MAMSGEMLAKGQAKESTITAVITRADGTVEHLGVVAYWHKNPLRRWLWALRNKLKGR